MKAVKVTSAAFPDAQMKPLDWFYNKGISINHSPNFANALKFMSRIKEHQIENGYGSDN